MKPQNCSFKLLKLRLQDDKAQMSYLSKRMRNTNYSSK